MGPWRHEVGVNVCSYSSHHVEAHVCDVDNNLLWKAVGIYRWPEATNKFMTWELMKNV